MENSLVCLQSGSKGARFERPARNSSKRTAFIPDFIKRSQFVLLILLPILEKRGQ
jgi:hypothetical protein